jgi:uncharacterized protein (UPF0332 family)
VSPEVDQLLARGREELRAAEVLLDGGLPSQALSRAYLAAFHAASAALTVVGERPLTRSGVVSAFGRCVIREGGLDHEVGRCLRRLFDDCEYVDYRLGAASAEAARSAVDDAARLVEATAEWIDVRAAAV